MEGIPNHLTSSHPGDICRDAACREAVKQDPATGRFYVTMGHPGFNSPTNNGRGYGTSEGARAAIRHYLAAGRRREQRAQALATADAILADHPEGRR